ncbi:Eukaryotic aspartyl protease family protein [Striga hermonthica]|uniref:Eukaryotic aspartyl protease family protein n=1 Tax=Striga hermonthica TaxID=68872 RepID=A0A9N7NX13_STRHE|nr:Eukaryotic aspartyl protease family protein [Striga hermonthica]
MSSSCVCWLLLLLLLLPVLFSPCWANSITLSLTTQSHHHSQNSSRLSLMAYASITRARHLKKCTSASTPLFPVDGEYSTTLEFGTPPQRLGFIMDTGSSLNWFPCGANYKCTFCGNATNIRTFNPKLSSSSKNASCSSPQVKRIIPDFPLCKSCWQHPTSKCSKQYLHYRQPYGSGITTGQFMLESLTLSAAGKNNIVPDLFVGCSNSSDHLTPYGMAGFGRGRESLPSQLGLKSFSYCPVSHRYDDDKKIHSDLVLNWGLGDGGYNVNVINYTPFAQNPNISPEFLEYYYVNLLEIHVGSVKISIPNKYLKPNDNGYGGTIVDSGTTFTIMEKVLATGGRHQQSHRRPPPIEPPNAATSRVAGASQVPTHSKPPPP